MKQPNELTRVPVRKGVNPKLNCKGCYYHAPGTSNLCTKPHGSQPSCTANGVFYIFTEKKEQL